jgi:transcriptional regulator with PAS, ATPase and Fis domain
VAIAALAGGDEAPFALVAVGGCLGHGHVGLLRVLAWALDGSRRGGPVASRRAGPVEDSGLVFPAGHVAGVSPAMAALYREMRPLSQGDLPVLITGETGVGKEHVARILHLSSPRRAGPFVAVNCAALPAELLEAELFGIGRGVATGVDEREGRFQQAQRGVLLLDEIADMPPGLQAKLLRALQEREVQPVGGRRATPVDVRVIASTNADPRRLVEEGRFRADLYYRIAGSVLGVPPLRERRQDVGPLVEHFVRVFAEETGKAVLGVTVRALAALERHAWPGNVRELEHEVRRMVYLCPHGQAIDSTLTPRSSGPSTGGTAAEEPLDLDLRLAELEERLVREALARTGGNRTRAARLLGISRNGLAIKMERLGVEASDQG